MINEKENLKSNEITPYDVVWTDSKISLFWDNMSKTTRQYYSDKVGKSILRFMKKYISFDNKNVLDYGCGGGGVRKLVTIYES
ncbi:MAG: hypothetical protein FWG70_06495 [Oscillospiraceae bacterium]|nr:hypothetical protein [Oscillospiraceae bacterium]